MDKVQFGLRVNRLREARGFTQLQLGIATGISHQYVSDFERGRSIPPPFETLEKLAAALGISIAELVKEAPDSQELEQWALLPEHRPYLELAMWVRDRGLVPGAVQELVAMAVRLQTGATAT